MQHNLPGIPEDDLEAREAIIQAILLASDYLWDRHKIVFDNELKRPGKLERKDIPPNLPTWKLFETLCILAILKNADGVASNRAINPFNKFGPLKFTEKDKTRYLWYQPSIESNITGLRAIPDIVITSDPTPRINSREDLNVIECKHRQDIGAQLIRSEYGKAQDLGVFSYLIWNWRTPKPNVVQSAKKLGLDLVSISIDSKTRQEFLREPHKLLNHVQGEIAQSRANNNFALAVINKGEETKNKLKLLD